jgi:hypothetical protein
MVDGGTYAWGEGGGYSVGGAISQAGPEQPAGGGYVVTGGFWHPVCRPQAVAVHVACSGGHVELSWVPAAGNMAYDIHCSTLPYFEPGPGTLQATVVGSNWTDPGASTCGDSTTNTYYQVWSTCIGAHAGSNRCGEFDFGLVPGS